MNKSINPFHYLIIAALAGLLFFPFLGSVHLFDWDEINFAESAREMLLSGDYSRVQINFQPFWEKPPLFIWMQAFSMKLFGVNEFAARFPNALFGILTLCLIYYKGRSIFKGHLAHWWVLCYLGSLTPHFYFKTGLIDPVFNFFIFLGILQFYEAIARHANSYNANRHFLWAGIYTGTAILCKGPVALLVSLLVLFAMVLAKRMTWFFNFGNLLIYLGMCALVSSLWFLPETIQHGPYFLISFVRYQIELLTQNVAGHQQPFYYHALVLLLGCFPVSVIAIATRYKNEFYTYNENLFRTVMQCLFWVVLILFSIVKTKIVHYSSLCWLPLTFLGAYGIESINQGVFRLKTAHGLLLILLGGLLATILVAIPLLMMFQKPWLLAQISDGFSRENLNAPVNWNYTDVLPGAGLAALMLYFAFRMRKSATVYLFGSLLTGTTILVFALSVLFVPKIEQHSQSAAIQFLSMRKGEDCYIFHTGYKSYAPYFYAETKPLKYMDGLRLLSDAYIRSRTGQNGKPKSSYLELSEAEKSELDDVQKQWLINGAVDKRVYFIAKTDDTEGLENEKNLEEIYRRNGFVAYRRR